MRRTMVVLVALLMSAPSTARAAIPGDRPLNLRTSDLYISAIGLNDGVSGGASGDGDGFAECGETVVLSLELTSVSETFSGAQIEVDPRGDFVHLNGAATSTVGAMAPGSVSAVGGSFSVSIDASGFDVDWISFVVWVVPPVGEVPDVFESHRHIPITCGHTSTSATISPPIVFPVGGSHSYSTYGWLVTARDLIHEGHDIFAPKGTPIYAAANGVIRTVNWANDPAHIPPVICCSLSIVHDSGWESWYSHLNNDRLGVGNNDDGQGWGIAPGIEVGTRVVAGQFIGWVGDSGNAENTSPHLHFELHDPSGIPHNPYPYLLNAVAAQDVPCTPDIMACRIAGTDRFDTAAKVSIHSFPDGADTVFIATGYNFPDALAGGPAAAALDAPILLVSTNAIPGATAAELARLSPTDIIILGGTAAISNNVATQLAHYSTNTPIRLSGPDRYATATAISRYRFPDGADTVMIATGLDFPDALAGGPAAAALDTPILLVSTNAIPGATAAELTRLSPTDIIILGGTAAISNNVATQLAHYSTNTPIRLSGPDRYATATAISRYAFAGPVDDVVVVTGLDYPDALAGGAAAGYAGVPLLTVERTNVPGSIGSVLAYLDPQRVTIVGGTSMVSIAVQAVLGVYLA